jgi:hypothetical protein
VPSTLRVTITQGPKAGSTFVVEAGVPAVVGRARDAAIVVDAPGLSRRHFEVVWDGRVGRVRDLGSRNGVLVNGRPVSDAVVSHGDVLEAGDSAFRIDVGEPPRGVPGPAVLAGARSPGLATPETEAVPLAILTDMGPGVTVDSDDSAAEQGSDTRAAELAAVLAQGTSTGEVPRLYAVVDGAQAFDLVCEARQLSCPVYTLFVGPMATAMAHVGPCLVPLARPRPFCRRWVARLGQHTGVLLSSRVRFETLYQHLRQLFVVTDEEGQEYFFRYYDPRVLRAFLPTCTPAELAEFFGPVDAVLFEDHSAHLRRASLLDGRLDDRPLVERPAAATPPSAAAQ